MSEIIQTYIIMGFSIFLILANLVYTRELHNSIKITSIISIIIVVFTYLVFPTPILWAVSWGLVGINFFAWHYINNKSVLFSAYKTAYNPLSKIVHKYVRKDKYVLNYTEAEYIEIASEIKNATDNIVNVLSKLRQNESLKEDHKLEVLKDLEDINTYLSYASAEFEIYMIADLGIDSMRNSELLNLWYPKSDTFNMMDFNKLYKPLKEKYEDGNYLE